MKPGNQAAHLASIALTLLAAAGFCTGAAAQTLTTLYSFTGSPDGARPSAGLTVDAAGNFYGTTQSGGASGCGPFGCGTVFKLTPSGSGAYSETVIYRFASGSDGANPYAGLIADAPGNLYGTTLTGGGGTCLGVSGCGTVFKLTPNGSGAYGESVLYAFPSFDSTDGAVPWGGLISDATGSLYGTTGEGSFCPSTCGTVIKLTPNGNGTYGHSVLYRFAGASDGANPNAGVVSDSMGNLYGTTFYGGGGGSCVGGFTANGGCGTVYKLTPNGNGTYTETVLYGFTGGSDGANPFAGLISDAMGNLYGTTQYGGGGSCFGGHGCGTVFRLTPNGNGTYTEAVLYRFTGGADGSNPPAGLISDAMGNLYGTTQYGGGSSNCIGGFGCGTVFKLTPIGSGTYAETVLYRFTGGTDGSGPLASLFADGMGNLYGTTAQQNGPGSGTGTVFKLSLSQSVSCDHDDDDHHDHDRGHHEDGDHDRKDR